MQRWLAVCLLIVSCRATAPVTTARDPRPAPAGSAQASPVEELGSLRNARVALPRTNEGASWERISPDLSVHDPATLVRSGGPIHGDMTGTEWYATVYAFNESPITKGLTSPHGVGRRSIMSTSTSRSLASSAAAA